MGFATIFLGFLLTSAVSTSPVNINSLVPKFKISTRDNSLLNITENFTSYSTPAQSSNSTLRAVGILAKRATFLYGPGVDFGGPWSPTGPLGEEYTANDSIIVDFEVAAQETVTRNDSAVATKDSDQVCFPGARVSLVQHTKPNSIVV